MNLRSSYLQVAIAILLAQPALGLEVLAQPHCVPMQVERSAAEIMVGRVISEEETFARLVFSEGISVGAHKNEACRKVEPYLYQLIAWGVHNRVRMGNRFSALKKKYGDGVRGVVFKPAQFNPAVSPKSRFREYFLCPSVAKDFALRWKWTRDAIRKVYLEPKSNPFIQTEWERNQRTSLVSHFYYPLSEQATSRPPKWANPTSPSRIRGLVIDGQPIPDDCIWFFRHEAPPAP